MGSASHPEKPPEDDSGDGGRARHVAFAALLFASTVAVVARDVYRPYVGGLGFQTPLFLAFFVWFFALYHFVASTLDERLWLIAVGSLLFYGSWGMHFVPLVLVTGFVDFYLAKAIAASSDPRKRRALLAVSVAMNVGVLALFKYADFFLANVYGLARLLGVGPEAPVLALAMPIGISFYTFQAISYTVDVYRGTIEPARRPHEFIAALTFFPHLAAGPIVRSAFLLPQFERPLPPRWADVKRASLLIAVGLLNKHLADLLGLAADPVFASDEPRGAIATWTGVLAFGGQVFGDFCGYTDMATGVALLLGFELPPNFDLPYLASSPIDFWRRWHISLSSWLRDYLWFPLARAFPWTRSFVVVVVMLVAGLWHGASWTFAAWGLYHGLLLVVAHLLKDRFPGEPSRALRIVTTIATLYAVMVGFVMFRAPTAAKIASYLREMHAPVGPTVLDRSSVVPLALVVSGLVLGHLLAALGRDRLGRLRDGRWLWPTVTVLLALSFSVSRGGRGFIYFQF